MTKHQTLYVVSMLVLFCLGVRKGQALSFHPRVGHRSSFSTEKSHVLCLALSNYEEDMPRSETQRDDLIGHNSWFSEEEDLYDDDDDDAIEELGEGLSLLEENVLLAEDLSPEDLDLDDDDLQEFFDEDDEEESFLTKNPITLEDLKSLTTKNTNIAYFYLQNEIGIAEEDMWKITHEAGSVLAMTANNLRRKVDLMRRLMNLTDDDIRTMLMRHPAVLHLSAKQNVAPTILFLQRSLDLSRQDLRAMIVLFPSILGYSLSNLKSKINFYLRLCLFTKDEARKLFVQEPKLLTAGVQTGLIPRLHFFVSELAFPLEELRVVVQKNPRVFLSSLEKNLQPKCIGYLIMTLGMNTKQVQKLLTKYPEFLNYNLENHILPMTRYFCQDLLFSNGELAQILLKFPRLVTWSLYKIKHVTGYLRYELGMDASQVKRVLYQAPQVINLNTDETLKGKIEFLRNALTLNDEEVRKVLSGMPTLAICSIDANLQPKITYLRNILGDEELKAAVLLQPTLLGYSLDKRLKPRLNQILEAGVHPRAITVGIPLLEANFQLWLNGRRAKAVLHPGYDTVRQVKRVNGVRVPDSSTSTAGGVLPGLSSSSDGRIIHWTRERGNHNKS